MRVIPKVLFTALFFYVHGAQGFIPIGIRRHQNALLSTRLRAEGMDEVQSFLQEKYPEFDELVKNNEELWKKLSDSDSYTIFAPNAAAFQTLGEKKISQLEDPRNGELSEKIGMFHVIAEVVTADALSNAGGVITMGGTVPVDKSISGGIFGVGGKQDGVTVGGAKVIQSINVGTGVIHEVDGLISPSLLWRYIDQLRIPGSR